MDHGYTGPVAKLLTYGMCDILRRSKPWPDYLAFGFTTAHIPELIAMAGDSALYHGDQDGLEVWGPVHAWRTLGQLGAEEAVQPLVQLFDDFDDDWFAEELPTVFAMIGPASIPALEKFLANDAVDAMDRISIPNCLEHIAKDHADARQRCVGVLTCQLEKYEDTAPILNGFLIGSLCDLKAVESIYLIREAYARECVDITVEGDLEDAEISIGVRKKRSTPRPRYNLFPDMLESILDDLDDGPDYEYDGILGLPVRRGVKIGRNEQCPCGSGKKYKKCCLGKNQANFASAGNTP